MLKVRPVTNLANIACNTIGFQNNNYQCKKVMDDQWRIHLCSFVFDFDFTKTI